MHDSSQHSAYTAISCDAENYWSLCYLPVLCHLAAAARSAGCTEEPSNSSGGGGQAVLSDLSLAPWLQTALTTTPVALSTAQGIQDMSLPEFVCDEHIPSGKQNSQCNFHKYSSAEVVADVHTGRAQHLVSITMFCPNCGW